LQKNEQSVNVLGKWNSLQTTKKQQHCNSSSADELMPVKIALSVAGLYKSGILTRNGYNNRKENYFL